MFRQILSKFAITLTFVSVGAMCVAVNVHAQDNVYVKSGGSRSKISGKISSMSPTTVVVTSSGKTTEVPSGNIRKIVFGSEPNPLDRARERFEDGRFDDCLGELQKINSPPNDDDILQEIDYLTAFATAEISLRGGNVTAQNAGKAMLDFNRNYPQSYRFFPATELLGRLFEAIDRVDLAEKEFTKLAQAEWPAYKTRGLFHLGNAQLKLKKFADAKTSFEAIQNVDANDDETVQFKQLAQCQAAKADALSGNPADAQAKIEAMIKSENPDNKLLFAHLYNALGACHESTQKWQEAAIAYLHTELLFSLDPDAHAESLKKLSEIWPKLDETDRANRATSTLKTRYRNSYWANQ